MKDLFAYFKVKSENFSQQLPVKRRKENDLDANEPKTCPLKKPMDKCYSKSTVDGGINIDIPKLNPGDICVLSLEKNLTPFPVIINDSRRDGSKENFQSPTKVSASRYGSSDVVWIDKNNKQELKVITSKSQLLDYIKSCMDAKINSEFEQFLHLMDFSPNERLDVVYSVDDRQEFSDDESTPQVKVGKKVSFLDDSDNEKRDVDSSVMESETSMLPLSKYSFQLDEEENGSEDDGEQSLLDLEEKLKKLKSENRSTQKDTMNLVENEYQHHHLEFLKDKFRKDINGVPHYNPDSDKTTLYVPNGFINSKEVTPVLKQWWKIKSENFDTVLLFKMGKFYETYHMDADTAVKELGLIYMRGSVAHAGFPEHSFPQYASTLVQKGYKVARVEQTETPQMMNERVKQKSSSKNNNDKVVNREICSIISPGTRVFDPFDVEVDAKNTFLSATSTNDSQYVVGFGMLAVIVDGATVGHSSKQSELGICTLDCSTGQFFFAQFSDDNTLSQLRTMLSSMPLPVAEVIIPKKVVSSHLHSFISRSLSHTRKEYTIDKIDSTQAILQLTTYFTCSSSDNKDPSCQLFSALDINSNDFSNYSLALIAISYCINYLKKNKIDRRIFSMKNFTKYVPKSNQVSSSNYLDQRFMVLDHNAITNLDILCNEDEIFNKSGSLIGLLDHCCTPFGHRLLPGLISQPLYHKKDIEKRLEAVEAIIGWDEKEDIKKQLRTLPDLHRLIFRIHANGDLLTNEDHPDNRAVIFNASLFNKKKVNDLLNALAGFNKLCDIAERLLPLANHSCLIEELLDANHETKCYQNTKATVDFFQSAFNVAEAKENGIIIPKSGVLVEYDRTVEDISELKKWFDLRLEEFKKTTSISSLKYWSSGKIRYYIEVPESTKKLPSKFIYKSQRKGFCRYALEELEDQVVVLNQLEDTRDKLLSKSLGMLLKKLSSNKDHLLKVIYNMSMIDCLFSFAVFSNGVYHGSMCRPVIIGSDLNNPSPFIHIEQGYHPYLASLSSDFVCNDFLLGNNESHDDNHMGERTMIITGPNMGGKSTLMRQVAVIVILAQLGCYVPAVTCKLTPVDRIFARLGASFDKPCNGQSTFYVELLETSTLLNHATKNSLVILDELGRGTATFDGMAIAGAVLEYISSKIQCLLLFSTHYHSLVRDLRNSTLGSHFKYYQMSFVIDELSNVSKSETRNTVIIFLYRLIQGVCSNSYGFHVARLTGLPSNIIDCGIHQANSSERTFLAKRLLEAVDSSQDNLTLANENQIQTIIDLFKCLVSV